MFWNVWLCCQGCRFVQNRYSKAAWDAFSRKSSFLIKCLFFLYNVISSIFWKKRKVFSSTIQSPPWDCASTHSYSLAYAFTTGQFAKVSSLTNSSLATPSWFHAKTGLLCSHFGRWVSWSWSWDSWKWKVKKKKLQFMFLSLVSG